MYHFFNLCRGYIFYTVLAKNRNTTFYDNNTMQHSSLYANILRQWTVTIDTAILFFNRTVRKWKVFLRISNSSKIKIKSI